jgi:hypothetical protein
MLIVSAAAAKLNKADAAREEEIKSGLLKTKNNTEASALKQPFVASKTNKSAKNEASSANASGKLTIVATAAACVSLVLITLPTQLYCTPLRAPAAAAVSPSLPRSFIAIYTLTACRHAANPTRLAGSVRKKVVARKSLSHSNSEDALRNAISEPKAKDSDVSQKVTKKHAFLKSHSRSRERESARPTQAAAAAAEPDDFREIRNI